MRRHGDTPYGLSRALLAKGIRVDTTTLRSWRLSTKAPSHARSLEILNLLERRWRLPEDYFASKLPISARAVKDRLEGVLDRKEARRLAWHLPDDFRDRPPGDQAETLAWVRRVIISGSTDYRTYQAKALQHRFAIRFPGLVDAPDGPRLRTGPRGRDLVASDLLMQEMRELLGFKTATLTGIGFKRRGVWSAVTARQKTDHLGLMLGALHAPAAGAVRGLGAPMATLSLSLLVFPRVWDWYLRWRETRRGFYTRWEADMLANAAAFTHPETGWLTQSGHMAGHLRPVPHLVSDADVERAQSDWSGACATLYRYALARVKEVERVARVHHDPFEPILPVLEADSPVAEYRKIADEVLRRAPCPRRYPVAAAEASRAFLMIRLGLHLGFRQKNLRQLLVTPRGQPPRTERQLTDLLRGELRWSDRDGGWEVFVPLNAFKNAHSSFFGRQPFRLVLPDLAGLYEALEQYLATHRPRLIGPAQDPGTLFVKSAKRSSSDAAYNQATFYEAWRTAIQRYGIFNPYTGRGAVAGLLPHGPHCVRDVLATHILKQTGSYEQASYAIQDTPEMVAQHYGRFLPADKAAIAAQILNRVWA
ncbi:hypothetical protein [Phenylobacterium sp.]|uniref:hypothetical protein n=1 Tax=Phenylobacterium sp. TaxID=1871053 RepID=UPI002FE0D7AD